MKTDAGLILKYSIITLCAILVNPSIAGQIEYSDDFYASGDTLTANNLNSKFNEIKQDVNDNHTNISANTNDISTNTDDINNNANAITALQNPTGAVAVTAHAFRTSTTGDTTCQFKSDWDSPTGYLETGDFNDCQIVAGIQIPDGATVTSLSCDVFDNTDFATMTANLIRHNTSSTFIDRIFITSDSEATGRQIIENQTLNVPDSDLINNSENAYRLAITFFNIGGSVSNRADLSLYSCKVSYQ